MILANLGHILSGMNKNMTDKIDWLKKQQAAHIPCGIYKI